MADEGPMAVAPGRGAPDGDGEVVRREVELEARRAQLLRVQGVVGLLFVAFLTGLALATRLAPSALDALAPPLTLMLLAALARSAWLHRRLWRCPACDTGWRWQDVLASAHWRRCSACGAALRWAPPGPEPWGAGSPGIDAVDPVELAARWRRARRLGLAGGLASVVALLAVVAWGRSQGWGELALEIVASAAAGLGLAIGVVATRCPRCRRGLVGREGDHCFRCGFSPGAR